MITVGRLSSIATLLTATLTATSCSRGADSSTVGTPDDRIVDAAVADRRADRTGTDVLLDAPLPPASNPGPWSGKDVGDVGTVKGRLGFGGNAFSLRAGGTDIDGAADSFYFTRQKIKGDCDVVARVRSLQMTDPAAKAGLMIRADDVSAGAANVFLAVLGDPAMGGRLQVRAQTGGPTTALPPDANIRAGTLLRLTRVGRTITAYRTVDRALGWFRIGSVDVDLPTDIAVGIAATSKSPMAQTIADFDILRLAVWDAPTAPRGWTVEELSHAGPTVLVAGSNVTLSGSGDGFNSTGEAGAFAFFAAADNLTLTARVMTVPATTPNARVGLMFRLGQPGNLVRGAQHAGIFVTPAGKIIFQARIAPSLNTVVTMAAEDRPAPVWLRLQRTVDPITFASTVTGLVSSDGLQWTPVAQTPMPLPEPFLVGISLTTGAGTIIGTTTLTDVTVTSSAVR